MKTYLIAVGPQAVKSLPTLVSSLSLGLSARPSDTDSALLSILTLDTQPPEPILAPMIRDDNEARYNAALPLARPAIRISVAWAESTELLQAMLDGSLTPQEYAEIVQYQAEMMMGE